MTTIVIYSIWSTYVAIAKLQVLILRKIWKFCMKFGHLIPRKIIEFVATRCQLSRLKCTKIDFGWDSASDPTGGLLLMEGRRGETEGKGDPVPDWESEKVATLLLS